MEQPKNYFSVTIIIYTMLISFFILGFLTKPVMAEEDVSREIDFTILHTNDEHSAIMPAPLVDYFPEGDDPTRGGFARMATAIENLKEQKEQQEEPVLLFNAGDFIGGGAFGWMAPMANNPDPELAIMQEMGYDAVTIGNHEYDYGPDILADYLIEAGYPEAHADTKVIASNTEAPPGHPLHDNDLYRGHGIFELEDKLKVGVFGLIGNQALLVSADTGELEFPDQHEVARNSIEELEEQGADVIVALTHSGIEEDRELAQNVDGIDVIVGGHCHTALDAPIKEDDTLIVQAGSHVEYLGCLELSYNLETEQISVRNDENQQPFLVPVDADFSPQENIEAYIDEYLAELNEIVSELTDGDYQDIHEIVAYSDFKLENGGKPQETPAGNFITDAIRFGAEEVMGKNVDVVLQTNGGIRQGIYPGEEHSPGEISFYEITEAVGIGYGEDGYPGYPLVSFYLTGSELLWVLEASAFLGEGVSYTSFLQASGVRYSYNPDNAVMFSIPFLDVPVPSLSVIEAEVYQGDGKQPAGNNGNFETLERDDTLYHVVTGTSLFSYIQMAADILPQFMEPKDEQGEPLDLDNPEKYFVHRNDGRELKLWETVVMHAENQPAGEDEMPTISDYYEEASFRIIQEESFPNVVWFLAILIAIIAGVIFLVRWRRLRKKEKMRSQYKYLV